MKLDTTKRLKDLIYIFVLLFFQKKQYSLLRRGLKMGHLECPNKSIDFVNSHPLARPILNPRRSKEELILFFWKQWKQQCHLVLLATAITVYQVKTSLSAAQV